MQTKTILCFRKICLTHWVLSRADSDETSPDTIPIPFLLPSVNIFQATLCDKYDWTVAELPDG